MSHSKIFRGLALFTAVTFFFFPVNLSATTALVGDARNQYQAEKKAELTLFTVSLDKPQSMQASGTNLLITVDSDSKATVDFFAASGEKVQTWSGLYNASKDEIAGQWNSDYYVGSVKKTDTHSFVLGLTAGDGNHKKIVSCITRNGSADNYTNFFETHYDSAGNMIASRTIQIVSSASNTATCNLYDRSIAGKILFTQTIAKNLAADKVAAYAANPDLEGFENYITTVKHMTFDSIQMDFAKRSAYTITSYIRDRQGRATRITTQDMIANTPPTTQNFSYDDPVETPPAPPGNGGGLTSGAESGNDAGVTTGIESGNDVGVASGTESGNDVGVASGTESGNDVGVASGTESGNDVGVASGTESGNDVGVASGTESGDDVGVASGTESGNDVGITSGVNSGISTGTATSTVSVPGNVTVTVPDPRGTILVSGTKDDNETSIWYTINGGPAKLLAASGGNSKNWSGVIKLSNGVSTLSVFAQKEKLIPSAAVILQPIYFLTAPTINASIVDGAFKMSGAKPKDTAIYYSINDGSYYQLTPVTDKDTWYADNIPMIPAGLSNYKISVMAIGTFKGPSGTDILISSPSASVGVPNPGATGAGNTTPGVLNTGTVLPAGTIPTTKVKPPAITKFSGTSLSSKSMTMSGTSDPNAMILVSVQGGNSAASVIADSGGNWSVNIPLAEGVNTINLMAEHDGVISSETTTTFDTTVKFAIDPNGLTGPSVLPWEDGVIHVGGTKTKGTSIWYSTNGGGFSELVPENADTSWGADIQLLPGDSNISIIAKKSLKIPGITITGDLLKLASPVQEIAAHVNLHAWVFHDSILDRYEDSQPPVLHVHFYGLLQAYATIGELIRHDEPGNPGYPSWLNTEISSNARNPTNGFYDFDRSIPAVVGISTYYFTVQSGNLAPALAEISLDCNVKNSKWVCAEVVGVNDPSPFVDAYKQPPSFVKLVTPASGTTTTPGAGTTTPSGSGTTPPASGSTTLTTAINPPAITNLSESSLSSDGMIINGTSEPNAKILAVLQGTDFATFVSADNAGHWAVKIPFTAGANTIIFQAELEGAVSSITTTTINVNATSVEAPTIDPSPSIPAAGSIIPTADGTVTVTGGKEAGTSIWYSINGGDLVELVSENTATQWGGTIQLSAGWSQLAFIARKVLTITGIAVSGGPVLLNSTPLNFYSFYSVKPPAPEVHYTGKAEVNADQGYSPDPLFRYAGRVDFWGMLPAHTTLFTYNEMTHEYVPLSVNDTSSDALFNVTLDTNTNGWQTFFFYSGIGYPAPNGSTTWIHNTTEYTMNCHFAPSGSSCTDGFEYRNPQ